MQKFTSIEYLKIAVANAFGKDKLSWKERIRWVEDQKDLLSLASAADEPAQFDAAVRALEKALRGEYIGYGVGLDATSSGTQWLAVLTRDKKAAKLCNVLGTGNREDIYTNIYNKVCEQTGNEAKIERAHVKKAIMTSLYASEAKPKEIFGEGSKALQVFYETMAEELPLVWNFNEDCKEFWREDIDEYSWTLPDNFTAKCKVMVPCKETIQYKGTFATVTTYIQGTKKKGRELSANFTHSVDAYAMRELIRRCMYDPEQIERMNTYISEVSVNNPRRHAMIDVFSDLYNRTRMVSLRLADYIHNQGNMNYLYIINKELFNAFLGLLDKLPNKSFEVYAVHDQFISHPNYCNDVRQQYIYLLAEVCDSTLLEHIICEYFNEEGICEYEAEGFGEEIIHTSEYALS